MLCLKMENRNKYWVLALCLLVLVAFVLASADCPTKEEYKERIKEAIEDYFTSPNPDKLMELQGMLRVYATHDFTKCLEEGEEGFIPEENVTAEVNQSEIDEAISLIVEADKVLAQTAIDFAKSLTVVDPDNQGEFDEQIFKAESELAKAEGFVSANEFKKAITHFKLAWKHAQNAIKIANKPVSRDISCSIVSGSCSGVSVFKMERLDNSHAQLQGSYSYTVCCDGVSGLGTDSSGTMVLGFAGQDNSHVQKSDIGTYAYKAYLSAPNGISCGYIESTADGYTACDNAGFDTCLASMQDSDNSQIGDCSAYSIKVCCKAD